MFLLENQQKVRGIYFIWHIIVFYYDQTGHVIVWILAFVLLSTASAVGHIRLCFLAGDLKGVTSVCAFQQGHLLF